MSGVVLPEMLADLPKYRVELVPQLPQDDVARLSAAQQARTGPDNWPLLPDRWLQENFLHLPDAALLDNMIKEQHAERMSPKALALVLAKAAAEQGRPELTQVYLDEFKQAVLQSMLAGGQMGGGAAPGAEPPGLPPTVLPFMQERGVPMPPNVPTGEEGRFGLPRDRG